MGFKVEILFKEGKENIAADSLSRMKGAELLAMVVNTFLMQKIKATWVSYSYISKLIQDLERDSTSQGSSLDKTMS